MNIALYKPEIPPNTGNIGRLCFCTETKLHIIGKPAFSIDESAVKRAGLDYWKQLDLHLHEDWSEFYEKHENKKRIFLFTRFAENCYTDINFSEHDTFVFGGESQGLPKEVLASVAKNYPKNLLRIPVSKNCRSLNLGNAASIVLYEALRQQNFIHLSKKISNKIDETYEKNTFD